MSPPVDLLGLSDRRPGSMSKDEREFAALRLAAALGASHVVCSQLAARSRLEAAAEPTYQAHAKAAFLHAAARFLHQARLVFDPGAEIYDWRDPSADLIQQDREDIAHSLLTAIAIDEQAVLAEAVSTLASRAAGLAAQASGPMATVLRSVQACIGAAARQLREAGQFAQTG
jgi:hypothetical protein